MTGEAGATEALSDEPPGFIALLDGSERALAATRVASELAQWYGRSAHVIEVTAGADDRDTSPAVAMQIEGTPLEDAHVVALSHRDFEPALFGLMRDGHIVVTAAFGVWASDGRLHDVINRLVRHDAPAVIGVGPNVGSDWSPRADAPIIVCVDDSVHAHELVAELTPFLFPARARIVVAHVALGPNADHAIAQTVADEIHAEFGLPVRAVTTEDESAAAGIAILASRLDAQLVITHSWHRHQAGEPPISSTSLTSAAHAPCPVVIMS